jgi:hypothetical protein
VAGAAGVLTVVGFFVRPLHFAVWLGAVVALIFLAVAQVFVAHDFWRTRNQAAEQLHEATEGAEAREAQAHNALLATMHALALEGERIARGQHPPLPPSIEQQQPPGAKRVAIAQFVEQNSDEWLARTERILKGYAEWVHLAWLQDADIPKTPPESGFLGSRRGQMYRRLNRLRDLAANHQRWGPVLRDQDEAAE